MKKLVIWLIAIYAGYLFFTTKSITLDKIYIINMDRSKGRYEHMQSQLVDLKLPAEVVRFSAFDGMHIELINKKTGERIKGSEFATNTKLLHGEFDVICSKEWKGNLEPLELDMIHFPKRFAGELGCSCSHRKIWQEIIDNGYKNTLIFEDDVFLAPFFDKYLSFALRLVPKDSELLYLALTGGTWTYNILNKLEYQALSFNNKLFYFIRDRFNRSIKNLFFKQIIRQPGTASAYIISNSAAKKILETPYEILHGNKKIISKGILNNSDVADGMLDDAVTRKIVTAYVIKPVIAKQKFDVIPSNISGNK